ncbi:MAG: pyrimidine-nucleoside phosphorylase [Lachnospiraceae bacterium]|nr:pyrimidine-nucleoside phosphorylase [Lachnospiraceae bacterium]MDY5742394.1 pyrimidine-nucleoside phosphorylase [Lachnospiraceae bacterium]
MRMYDLIMKKRNGLALTAEEIKALIDGYVAGEVPDYQMSAFLMAGYFQGMTAEETTAMTLAVADSGDRIDLSGINGMTVDKHSTGGVGDKTTMIVAPIVAACGVKVAKMSGRGLGHTGGTLDKLESIPGFQIEQDRDGFFDIVNRVGVSVIGQSGNLAPGDKKLYALRDVTATVDSIPLIAVSIMSKKLAAGSDGILLDVKTGSGAFMKTLEDSIALAKEMVSIGETAGRRTVALITDMDRPLGHNIGNSLEVIEAIETLHGRGPQDLTEVCLQLAANMLYIAGHGEMDACLKEAQGAIDDGSAFAKLVAMVEAQSGDTDVILHPEHFARAAYSYTVTAPRSGYITSMDTEGCGIVSVMLGAGRETKESSIDYSAGLILHKKVGDQVEQGEPLATLYAADEAMFAAAAERYLAANVIEDQPVPANPLVYARVTKDAVERL